jgi:histidinol-phosphate aminotransferase
MTEDQAVIVVGVGAGYGIEIGELRNLIVSALAQTGLPLGAVSALATVESKAREQAIHDLAAELDVPLVAHNAKLLSRVAVPNPSDRVASAVGTASVAEAAAVLGIPRKTAGRLPNVVDLLVPKTASPRATVAIARHRFDPVDLHHHGDDEVGDGLLDLAVNVRPDPLPDWLAAAIGSACDDLLAYPDAGPATEAVAQRHRRQPGEVLLTAGAAEAFTLIAQGIPPSRAVIVHPQFTEPEVALRAAGWQLERVLLDEDSGFAIAAARIHPNADVVVIGNPTNPTGTLHPAETLLALRQPGRLLVVDEAFMDSIPGEPESLAEMQDLTGVLVVRSLTKTWGLAGLRIGYLLGDAGAIAKLKVVQPHWAVSTPALAAAAACMSDEAAIESARRAIELTAERERVRIALTERGFRVSPTSYGPFLLIRHPHHESVHTDLRQSGIAVRRADTFPGLGPGWVRISIRDAAATGTLLAALDKILAP